MVSSEQGVGKSSVSVAFCSGTVPGNLPATVGIDIVMKTIEVGGKRVQLQMYDPAGHVRTRFETIARIVDSDRTTDLSPWHSLD